MRHTYTPAALVVLLVLAVAAPAIASELSYAGPLPGSRLEAPPKRETSGIAASRRAAGMLWVHDDSGGKPVLYAVSSAGKLLGAIRVQGVTNEDWEDVASYERDGKAWLIIADVGDNDAQRPTVWLHIVEEPPPHHLIPEGELSVKPARSLRVRYEDGPRDCESVAVDVSGRAIYLLTKRDNPPRLYQVDLDPTRENAIVIARRAGHVPHIPQPTGTERLIKGHLGRRRAEVTGMDFAADGSAAVVVTYGELLLFPRQAGEPWPEAFSRHPIRLPPHKLMQAEAVCFSPDGKIIYVASEGARPMVRYERTDPK